MLLLKIGSAFEIEVLSLRKVYVKIGQREWFFDSTTYPLDTN